jgi:hypothetical protein
MKYVCTSCGKKEVVNLTNDEKYGSTSESFTPARKFYCFNCEKIFSWKELRRRD